MARFISFTAFAIPLVALLIIFCLGQSQNSLDQIPDAEEREFETKMEKYANQLSEVDEKIQIALRRLQIIKKIKSKSIIIPSLVGVENLQNSSKSGNDTMYSYESFEQFLVPEKSIENIDVIKNFIERQVISAPNDQDIIKFTFMQTPNFVTTEGESLTKVILCLLKDGTLAVYSSASGHFIDQLDLKNFTDISTAKEQILDMQACTAGNEFSLYILSSNGDVHIVNFDLKRLELIREEPQNQESEKGNKTVTRPLRFPKSIKIISTSSFNIWKTAISTNATLYEDKINEFLKEGIEPISLEYLGRPSAGNFIIADNKGYFNLFKKTIHQSKTPNENNQSSEVTLIKRVYSGFDSVKIIKRFSSLIIFTSESNIGFLRAFDGDLASSQCEVGTSKIVALDFDKENTGKFYVGTDLGEIIAFGARHQERNEITCEIEGKMMGDQTGEYSISVTKQMVLKLNKNGDLHAYNVTSAKQNPSINEYSLINFVNYKPYYPQTESNEISSVEIVENASDIGNVILLRVPGTTSKLLFMEIINNEIITESLLITIMKNKIIMFVACLVIVFVYQFFKRGGVFKNNATDELYFESKKKTDIPKSSPLDKLNDLSNDKYLEAIAQRLKGLDDTAERLHKFTEDASDLRSKGSSNINQQKYGKKVQFLDEDD